MQKSRPRRAGQAEIRGTSRGEYLRRNICSVQFGFDANDGVSSTYKVSLTLRSSA